MKLYRRPAQTAPVEALEIQADAAQPANGGHLGELPGTT
jgi:hypothetical protein